MPGDGLGLLPLGVFAELARVAARGRRVFGLDLDELRAEALDLLLDDLAHVERLDDGAEAARGADGLEPGDAGAEDEDARRGDGPGRGHEHGKEAAGARPPP